jgi:hypothetical protein
MMYHVPSPFEQIRTHERAREKEGKRFRVKEGKKSEVPRVNVLAVVAQSRD